MLKKTKIFQKTKKINKLKIFRNLKISQKLFITIFISIIFLCIVGIVGLFGVNRMYNNGEAINDQGLTPITKLIALKSNFVEIRANVEAIMNPNNSTATDTYERNIEVLIKKDEALMQEYESLNIEDEKEKEIYQKQVKDNLASFDSSRAKIIELCKQKDYKQAQRVYKSGYFTDTTAIDLGIQATISESVITINSNVSDNDAAKKTVTIMLIITIVLGGIISCLFGLIIAKGIIKKIKKVMSFTEKLGNGDLSNQLEIVSKDELDTMAISLNKAVDNVRNLVSEITASAQDMGASSEELTATMEEVSATMSTIKQSAEEISKGNGELTSSTYKVSDSVLDIQGFTTELFDKARSGEKSSDEIKERAVNIKEKANISVKNANDIYAEKEIDIRKAIKDIEVVKEVTKMTDVIKQIAEQTNLLSLNASIEAARAGEYGRGFSVVADEVRKLAVQSETTAKDIKKTIDNVTHSINNLVTNTNEVMSFIENQVKPDYVMITDVGIQYEKDAEFVNEMSKAIAISSKTMSTSISEVNCSIQNVSATTEEFTSNSEEIQGNIAQVATVIEEVAKQAEKNSQIAEKLSELTEKFKI